MTYLRGGLATHRVRCSRITSDTLRPSASALSRAASQSSSEMRTARSVVPLGISGDSFSSIRCRRGRIVLTGGDPVSVAVVPGQFDRPVDAGHREVQLADVGVVSAPFGFPLRSRGFVLAGACVHGESVSFQVEADVVGRLVGASAERPERVVPLGMRHPLNRDLFEVVSNSLSALAREVDLAAIGRNCGDGADVLSSDAGHSMSCADDDGVADPEASAGGHGATQAGAAKVVAGVLVFAHAPSVHTPVHTHKSVYTPQRNVHTPNARVMELRG